MSLLGQSCLYLDTYDDV